MSALTAGPISLTSDALLTFLLAVAAVLLVSFFIGSVNPAAIFARMLGKSLSAGSGNPGATNAGRVLGLRWGVVVGLLDVLKGFVPVWVCATTIGPLVAYLAGIAAVLGHIFSPFLRGRGGKGVATALGVVLGVHPVLVLVVVLVFGIGVLLGRQVAAGSVAAAAALLVFGATSFLGMTGGGPLTGVWAVTLGVIVVTRHTPNIRSWLARAGPSPTD